MRADYVYDALERLALRTTQNMTPSGTTHYVYDRAGRLLVEASATGTTIREYVWLDDMPLAIVADVDTATPKLWFVHADHLDRPIKMTDDARAVVWNAVYRPFGEVHAITGTGSNNLRFPGQYFLMEAGLHYNWHRHYDATIGRYLQPDPLGFIDGPSVYSYVGSRPTIDVDPRGLQAGRNFTPIPKLDGLQFCVRRQDNISHCRPLYVICHNLHGGSLLINGKRCGDCFDICTLNGYWPFQYCPLRPF